MFKMYFDEGATGGSAAAQQQATGDQNKDINNQGEGDLTFDGFYASLNERAKSVLENHTSGLKKALDSERENRKELEKQIKLLAAGAHKEGELKTQLEQMSAQMETLSKQTAFLETAHREGVSNPRALFTLAQAGDFFDKKGNANFAELRKEYPEFFPNPKPKGNAGAGTTDAGGAVAKSMNDLIRAKAGIG